MRKSVKLAGVQNDLYTITTKRRRNLPVNSYLTGTEKRPGRFIMIFKIFCTVAEYIVIFGSIVIMCALLAEGFDDNFN